jgi:hypothetical protein
MIRSLGGRTGSLVGAFACAGDQGDDRVAVSSSIQTGSSDAVEIHYSTVFDGVTPTLCGRDTVPKPATSDRSYVSCRACLGAGSADISGGGGAAASD